jgi:hypothetical protein
MNSPCPIILLIAGLLVVITAQAGRSGSQESRRVNAKPNTAIRTRVRAPMTAAIGGPLMSRAAKPKAAQTAKIDGTDAGRRH